MALHKHFLLQSTFDHPQKCTTAKCQIAHLGLICLPEHGGTLREGGWGRFLSPSVLSGNKDRLLPLPGWLQTCGVWPAWFFCAVWVGLHRPTAPYRAAPQSAPQLGWQLHGGSSGKCTALNKGEVWAGRNQCREGKNRRKGSLVSYNTVSSVLTEQQIGIRQGNLTAVQTKWQEEIYLPSSITAKLCLS